MLEQVSPAEDAPICLGTVVTYTCTVQASQLVWVYSAGSETITFLNIDEGIIGQVYPLGAFDVVLNSINSTGGSDVLVSSATSTNGLTAAVIGQSILCFGLQEEDQVISVSGTCRFQPMHSL